MSTDDDDDALLMAWIEMQAKLRMEAARLKLPEGWVDAWNAQIAATPEGEMPNVCNPFKLQ